MHRWLVTLVVCAMLAGCPQSDLDFHGLPWADRVEAPDAEGGEPGAVLADEGEVRRDPGPPTAPETSALDPGRAPDARPEDPGLAVADEGPAPDPGSPLSTDPGTVSPSDPGAPPEDSYRPPFIDHPDPTVEKCLELIPAVCSKLETCDIPFVPALGQLCPTLAEAGSALLVGGCEQLVGLAPDGAVGDIIANFALSTLEKCIADYDCNLENALRVGQRLLDIFQTNGGAQGGDLTQLLGAVLPDILALVLDECGASLPFPF